MIQLIVGLGNPGAPYERTRHNVGAWFVERLAEQEGVTLKYEPKFFGLCANLKQFPSCWLLKPTTYMNESGKSVAALAKFYKIPVESILVAHDELDFEAGAIRFKEGGGHGGHNGLRNIIQCLPNNNFYRLRIGIGHPGHRDAVTPYVLSEPSRSDKQRIEEAIDNTFVEIPLLIAGEFQRVFQNLHSKEG